MKFSHHGLPLASPRFSAFVRPLPLYSPRVAARIAVDARAHAAIVVPGLETRRDFIGDDVLALRIGQHAFQPVAHLQKHFVILHKNEKHRAV